MRRLDNWIDSFMEYTDLSESPDSFLKWTAISVISGVVERKVYVEWFYDNYYPNMFVILVGPPARTHKSATINRGLKFLREASVPRASEALTKEALIGLMKLNAKTNVCSITVATGELMTFIQPSGPAMIEFLTHMYDCPDYWEYTTKARGSEEIKNAYVTLIAGTTHSWMGQQFDPSFLEQGFSSRCIFISETEPRFLKAFGKKTPRHVKLANDLSHDLREIGRVAGEYEWTKAGEQWFTKWYETRWPKEKLDYKLESYHGRKPTHILKLAMVLDLARKDYDKKLDEWNLSEAKEQLEALESSMAQAFSAVGRNPYAADLERIWRDIRISGGLYRSDIKRRNYGAMDRMNMDNVMEELIDMNAVKPERRGGDIFYHPVKRD